MNNENSKHPMLNWEKFQYQCSQRVGYDSSGHCP